MIKHAYMGMTLIIAPTSAFINWEQLDPRPSYHNEIKAAYATYESALQAI